MKVVFEGVEAVLKTETRENVQKERARLLIQISDFLEVHCRFLKMIHVFIFSCPD